jgi:uncharacterized protein YggE
MESLMMRFASLVALSILAPATAAAQQPVPGPAPALNGLRLDIVAAGEVSRAPDLVTISAGVATRAAQAEAALRDNAARMERVRAALRRLGIAPRDVQTGSISLSQDYERRPEGARQPTGYVASNQLNIRFRDVANAGRIIDALVAEGVNSVQGPSFGIQDREGAVNQARMHALAQARSRADLYARSLGTRVRRIVAVSEAGPMQGIVYGEAAAMRVGNDAAATAVEPGEQIVAATLTVTFELEQPSG